MTRSDMDRALWVMVQEHRDLLAVVQAIHRRTVNVAPCTVCGQLMEVPLAARLRTEKKYCSAACSSKAHRLRLLQSETLATSEVR